MLQFLLLAGYCITICLTRNIDIEAGPILKTRTAATYFGYSATGVVYAGEKGSPSWVAVGSPKANTSRLNRFYISPKDSGKYDGEETGALYNCSMDMDPKGCTDITKNVVGDSSPAILRRYNPKNGWYGVSVAGGRSQDSIITVCAHRPIATFPTTVDGDLKSLPGICVVLNKDDISHKKDVTKIYYDNYQSTYALQRGEGAMSYQRSQYGATGIAATVLEGDKCYAAAIGDGAFSGSLVSEDDAKFYASDEDFAYGGYSVATGAFFTKGTTAYAAGAPRYNMTGAVLLYKTLTKRSDSFRDPNVIIRGRQYGSYFGMSICAADFDGDGLFEVVVGAPYYAGALSLPSSGKVYVYSSKDNFGSPVQMYEAPNRQAHALFGKAVAVIGDVDLNGYNDLAIGSPYEDDGVMYIYYGSKDGLSKESVQIIKASDFPSELKTFGWSVRGETDLDKNGYPDIVVGAYASDSIMILRSVPVVVVDISYQLSSTTVDVSNKSCRIKDRELGENDTVCFDVEVQASYKDRAGNMADPIKLSFDLHADTLVKNLDKKRVRFQKSQNSSLKIANVTIYQGQKTSVVNATAYLRVDKISPYPDIELKVIPELPERRKPPAPPTSGPPPELDTYFQLAHVVNDDVQNFTKTKINIVRACDPCIPNLMIKNIGDTKIPVQSKDIYLKIEVRNAAEQAYGTSLRVVLPPLLRFQPCNVGSKLQCLFYGNNCERINNDTIMTCELGNFKKENKIYTIRLDTAKASDTFDTYVVKMNVSSVNKEHASLLGDNSLSLELKVASSAKVEIRGDSTSAKFYSGSVRGQFAMRSLDEIGLEVIHKYKVSNLGPDKVPEVNITIQWPYEAKSGKHLLYLVNITNYDKVECFPKPGWINSLASQFEARRARRARRSADESENDAASSRESKQGRKGSSSTIVLDCANGTAMCISIPCTVKDIGPDKTADIKITSRIWNGTLLEDYSGRDVGVVSRARIDNLTSYVDNLSEGNQEDQVRTSFYPLSPKTTKKEIEVWVIVVSAIAGVVLLIILIVVFKMCGFFNRSSTKQYDAVPES